MGDDHLAANGFLDEFARREVSIEWVDHDVGDLGQFGKSPLIVRIEVFGIVGEKDSQATSVAQRCSIRQPERN